MKLNITEQKITTFLNYVINCFNPDYIVTVERKGTALLRAEIEQGGVDWSWHKVLSTSAIPGLETNYLYKKRVLLFDDSVNHGHSMNNTADAITKKFDDVNIATAAFVVHENCRRFKRPDFYFYLDLKDDLYEEVKKSIICFLQERGSLLLDTEHIEIPIDLKGSTDDFYKTVGSLGKCIHFESIPAVNKNLTLFHPFRHTSYFESFKKYLPNGSNVDDGVFKCRLVSKSKSNRRISLIPICYPIIPANLTDEDKDKLPICFRTLLSNGGENYKLVCCP